MRRSPQDVPGWLGLVAPAGTKVQFEDITAYSLEHTLRRADANGDGVATRGDTPRSRTTSRRR